MSTLQVLMASFSTNRLPFQRWRYLLFQGWLFLITKPTVLTYHLICYDKFRASSVHCCWHPLIISMPCPQWTLLFHQHKTILCSGLLGWGVTNCYSIELTYETTSKSMSDITVSKMVGPLPPWRIFTDYVFPEVSSNCSIFATQHLPLMSPEQSP